MTYFKIKINKLSKYNSKAIGIKIFKSNKNTQDIESKPK